MHISSNHFTRGTLRLGLLVAVLAVATTPALHAATLRVPEEYPTIQAAIDAAMDGDEILVGPGTYPERLQISTRVTITGREGAGETIIDAEGTGQAVAIHAYDVVLHGLTIQNGLSSNSASGLLATVRCFLSECRFVNHTSANAGVLELEYPGSEVIDCVFAMNTGHTIVTAENGPAAVEGYEFRKNSATYAILYVPVFYSNAFVMRNTRFDGNQASVIVDSSPGELRLHGCAFVGNEVSSHMVNGGDDNVLADSLVDSCWFSENHGGLISLGSKYNFAAVRGCVFLRNDCGDMVGIPFAWRGFGSVADSLFIGNTSNGQPLINAFCEEDGDFFVSNSRFFFNDALPISFRDCVAGIGECVFFGNRVSAGPASIRAGSGEWYHDVVISDCIFWGNESPDEIEILFAGGSEIDDCLMGRNSIEGGREAVIVTGGWDLFYHASNEMLIPSSTTAFGIRLGTHLSGGLPELLESDDTHLRIRSAFGFAPSEPNIVELRASTRAPDTTEDLVHVLFAAETRLNQANGTEKFRIRNWNTGGFDVHSIRVPATEDFIFISQPLEAGPYVRASDGKVQLSIRQSVLATFSAQGFISSTDLIAFAVTVPEP